MTKLYSFQLARLWLGIVLLAGLICYSPTYVGAQSVTQLTNTASNPPPAMSDPSDFQEFNGRLYFSAKSTSDLRQLFSTDGTPAGTQLVKSALAMPLDGSDPKNLTVFNGRLYFSAKTNAGDRELWSTDGTPGGTALFKDIKPGSGSGDPMKITATTNKLYFTAVATVSAELWVSDGTPAGTQRLADDTGVAVGGVGPSELIAVGNKLFYSTSSGGFPGLWVSDGTSAGTYMVRGGPNVMGSMIPYFPVAPSRLSNFGDKLLFRASGQESEDEPWISDGTTAGTFSLNLSQQSGVASFPDIDPKAPVFNGRFYFYATQARPGFSPRSGIFSTDGTLGGTQFISSVHGSQYTVFAGKLYFTTSGGSLWETDGTEAGTHAVAGAPANARNLAVASGKLYFTVPAGSGDALWVSDGTTTGIRRVIEYTGTLDNWVKSLMVFSNQLYLTALSFSTSTPELFRLNANQAPIAPVIANATGTVGQYFNQTIPSFTDPDGFILMYELTGLPANLIFSGGAGGIVGGIPAVAGVFLVTVTARDLGGLLASTTYTLTINPASPPVSTLHLLAPTYDCVTGVIELHTSGGDGSLITYVAPGISRGSNTNTVGVVEYELRKDPKPIPLQAIQSGVTVSYTFDLPGICGGGSPPPSGGSLKLLPPTYDCITGVIQFHTGGGDGSLITYIAPGITRGSNTNTVGVVEYELRKDPKPILLQAIQNGVTVSYTFDLPGICGGSRMAATSEPGSDLSVNILGNPVINETADVEIRGATGLPLMLIINDMQGRPISHQRIDQAASTETRTIRVGKLAGTYLLRVTTPTQTRTIKLLRQ